MDTTARRSILGLTREAAARAELGAHEALDCAMRWESAPTQTAAGGYVEERETARMARRREAHARRRHDHAETARQEALRRGEGIEAQALGQAMTACWGAADRAGWAAATLEDMLRSVDSGEADALERDA